MKLFNKKLINVSLRGWFVIARSQQTTKQSFDKLKTGSRLPRFRWSLAMTKHSHSEEPKNPSRMRALKRPLSLALIFSLILGIVIIAPWKNTPTAQAAWYSTGGTWNYRKAVTFTADAAKIPSTQTDFPVLISITDAGLAAHAKANGDDILFTSSNATTKLSHEIESYTSATGALVAWVKVPSLATSGTIYIYYGNSSATSQQNKTDVWSNGYVAVWHFADNLDSTGHGYTLETDTGVSYVSGNIGGGIDIPAGSLLQHAANNIPIPADTKITAWYKRVGTVVNNFVYGRAGYVLSFRDMSSMRHYITSTNYVESSTGTSWTYTGMGTSGGNAYPLINGTWGTPTATTWAGGSYNFGFGQVYTANSREVLFGEARIESFRTADWIATEYANQNDSGTFFSLAGEEIGDLVAPSNPTSISGYSTSGKVTPITSGNYYNYPTPYFEWPVAEAAGGAHDTTGGANLSAVAGYYSYFGTSCGGGGADPAVSRGVLADTGSGLHYSTDINVSVPDLTTNQGAYCLRLKTKDNAGNISAVTEVATYNFDTTNPNAPTFVAVNPAGYSSTNSFDFTWPVAADVGSGASGVGGYQYKRGNGTDDWSATQVGTSKTGITSYATGENIFLVRSIDNAGNVSSQVQTTYYYSSDPPTKPTALAADPTISDTNSFAFSWTAPVHARPIVDYGYSINATPTVDNLTWKGNATASLTASPFATAQGENTLYLVAKDDSGAYALDAANYATVSFNCTTSAPPIPLNLTISDSSNRAYSTYSLTIKWSAGTGQDSATFDHYLIERSTDPSTGSGQVFTELSTTTSTAYIDVSSLSNSTTYYYRVKAVDNADSVSASSTVVSRIPTGKYTTPPTIIQGPESTAKASTATIKWVTSRISTAGVRFGLSEGNLDRSQIDPTEATEHSITIPGLEGGKRYYYQVQSLDNDRDYASDDAYGATAYFDTLALPVIADVKISNITLFSADLSWITSTASNTKVSSGTTISYGTDYEDTQSYTTNHTYKLTDLAHTTTYHFKITGTDQDGNTLVSDDYVFDTLPMPKISAVNFETDLAGTEPKSYITWTTNVATTSSVDYTPKNASASYEESQSSYVTSHKVELSKLSDNTAYSFYVYGTDQFGNTTKSDEYSFATPFDSRAAIITNVSVEASNVGLDKQDKAQLIVSWHTDEVATTQVEYGQGVTGDYTNKTSEDKTLSNEHFVIVNDLVPNTPYHLRAISRDKGENISMSDDTSSVPGEVPKSILQTLIDSFNSVFGWMGGLL